MVRYCYALCRTFKALTFVDSDEINGWYSICLIDLEIQGEVLNKIIINGNNINKRMIKSKKNVFERTKIRLLHKEDATGG